MSDEHPDMEEVGRQESGVGGVPVGGEGFFCSSSAPPALMQRKCDYFVSGLKI